MEVSIDALILSGHLAADFSVQSSSRPISPIVVADWLQVTALQVSAVDRLIIFSSERCVGLKPLVLDTFRYRPDSLGSVDRVECAVIVQTIDTQFIKLSHTASRRLFVNTELG